MLNLLGEWENVKRIPLLDVFEGATKKRWCFLYFCGVRLKRAVAVKIKSIQSVHDVELNKCRRSSKIGPTHLGIAPRLIIGLQPLSYFCPISTNL